MDANKDDKAIGINKAPILTWHKLEEGIENPMVV